MSLLLDALKKAAEQKARKSKSEADAPGKDDASLLDVAADVGARARPDDGSEESNAGEDTEFDHTELTARLERSSVVRGSTEETALEIPDATQTTFERSEPVEDHQDETALEIPDATRTTFERSEPVEDHEDETMLEIPDATQTTFERSEPVEDHQDETMLEIPDATQTAFERSKPVEDHQDETAQETPDATETRLRTDSPQRASADETSIDLPDQDALEDDDANLSEQLQTGDDETIIFPADEDLTGTGEIDQQSQAAASSGAELWDKDETRLDPVGRDSANDNRQVDDDETDYQQPARSADEVEVARVSTQATGDAAASDDDQTLEPGRSAGKVPDDDLSLLLIEPDPTNTRNVDTSFTDPQALADRQRVLEDDALGLKENTQSGFSSDQTDTQGAITNPSHTAIYGDNTRVGQDGAETESNLGHSDATSTHTYAPDNYDRTLMKLPSDDESRLFAGMKSDSDVIMTPDYAKKVFRSKTSAQRLQHYKVYLGLGVVILLSIGIYGGMQYQEESLAIDDNLRPLKRDPMPGLIKPKVEEDINLFAATDSESTARTIEIIQAAEPGDTPLVSGATDTELADTIETTTPEVTDSTTMEPAPAVADAVVADEPEEIVIASATEVEPAGMEAPDVAEAPTPAQPQTTAQPVAESAASDSGSIAMLSTSTPDPASAETAAGSTSNLQILSSNQYRQNDLLLREAYEAYLAGNDAKALELYNQVLKVDPGNRNALLARAAINVQNSNVNAAVRDYQALLLLNPKDSLAMSSLLAVAEYSPQEAETQLKLMIRDEPESPYLNFALANAYGAQNRWLQAQRHYFTALQNNPKDPNYAYNLAVSLEHIAQPQSAAVYYQHALDNIDNGLATFSPDVVNQRLSVLGRP